MKLNYIRIPLGVKRADRFRIRFEKIEIGFQIVMFTRKYNRILQVTK